MIYLDSSALLKLLFEEQESNALQVWLESRASLAKVSSELAKIEVVRATRRLAPDAVPTAMTMLTQLDLVPLSGAVVEQAAHLGEAPLRSLDALHLASAITLGTDLAAFIGTYWKVSDRLALEFAQALYGRLLAGVPIGQAAREARAEIRTEGTSTWLAYTVFADPWATVAATPPGA